MTSRTEKYLPGVDGLRAIAVMAVILFHAGIPGLSGGFVGVDVFFVISGFLITRLISSEISSTGKFSFTNFYLRRARRLLPALFVTLAFCILLGYLLLTPQHLERFGKELLSAVTSVSNIFFWSEAGYFNTASEFKPLLHTWSLSVEEQFYVVWPALLLISMRLGVKRGAFILLSIIFILSLSANFIFQNGLGSLFSFSDFLSKQFSDGASTIFFLTPFRLFEFVIGAALVWIRPSLQLSKSAAEICMISGLLLMAYSIAFFNENTLFPSYNALFPCVGAALVILSVDAPLSGWIVRNRASNFIGLISYSVYLVHAPLLVYYKYWKIIPISLLEKCSLVVASIFLGYLLYRFVETPFRHQSAMRSTRRLRFRYVAPLLLIPTVTAAALAWRHNGVSSRVHVPPEIAAQMQNSKQFHIDNYGGAGFPDRKTWMGAEKKGKVDFVVIGDSHAGHYKQGFSDFVAIPMDKSVFFHTTGCLLLPGLSRSTPGSNWNEICKKTIDDALTVLRLSPGSTLVLAESWVFEIPLAIDAHTGIPLLTNGNYDAAFQSLSVYLDALRREIKGHRLILIGDVPGAGIKDSIGCWLRPSFLNYNCEDILTSPRDSNQSLKVNAFLGNYARLHANVTFLNPFDALCEKDRCIAFKDKKILYSDQYHLSKEGSRLVISKFKDAIISRNSPSTLDHEQEAAGQ